MRRDQEICFRRDGQELFWSDQRQRKVSKGCFHWQGIGYSFPAYLQAKLLFQFFIILGQLMYDLGHWFISIRRTSKIKHRKSTKRLRK